MEHLTFGEQVKIILGRKGMTIKQLAELIEEKTGKKMSRQNLTQRLGRDNFQEQDMRMIAQILECPFQLSIMSGEQNPQPRSTAALERAAAARTEAVERRQDEAAAAMAAAAEEAEAAQEEADIVTEAAEEIVQPAEQEIPAAEETAQEEAVQEEPEQEEAVRTEPVQEEAVQEEPAVQAPGQEELAPDERDMTIGELYEMHRELSELEENIKAGEPVEEIKKELEKPKKEGLFSGGLFLRRKQNNKNHKNDSDSDSSNNNRDNNAGSSNTGSVNEQPEKETPGPERKIEPVLSYNDVEEDTEAGDVNPYTGKEYQTNSVRMHPTRIGYVQVYDRSIHKWTDMTEWAFLGLQERRKALLGKAYEPPIYLD